MKSEQEKEVNKVIKEIEEETKDIIQNYYKSKDLSTLNVKQEEATQDFLSIFTQFLSGVATMTGIAIGGAATVGGVAISSAALGTFFATSTGVILGVVGLGVGVAVGALIGWLWGRSRTRDQYYSALVENKRNLIDNFTKVENSFSNDYDVFHQTLMKEMRAHVSALYEEINFDNSKWVKMKEEYKKQKENIRLKLKNKKHNL